MSKKRKSTSRRVGAPARVTAPASATTELKNDTWADIMQKLEKVEAAKAAGAGKSGGIGKAGNTRRTPVKRENRPQQNPAPIHVDPTDVKQRSFLERLLYEVTPHKVAATYSLDTTDWTGGNRLTVRFRGQLSDAAPDESTTFVRDEVIEDIEPGTGRISLTMRQSVRQRGLWRVSATPLKDGAEQSERTQVSNVSSAHHAVAFGPGVNLLSWPLLVALGAMIGLALQLIFLSAAGWPWWQPFLISSAGIAVGMVGARLWFLKLHRKPLREFLTAGACIQGFIVGMMLVLLLGALAFKIPPGTYFDLSAPGMFLGLAVGRVGCFLTGCCYGRPTASRWSLWSSDRCTGRRRYPVQLYEATAALVISLLAFIAVLLLDAAGSGAVFVIGLLLYIIVRQVLFPLRRESRTQKGRLLTMLVSVAGILATGAYGLFFVAG